MQQFNRGERVTMKNRVELWVSQMTCVICCAPLRLVDVGTSARLNAVQADVECSRCGAVELRVMVSDCDVPLLEQRQVFKSSGGSKADLRRALRDRRLAKNPWAEEPPSGP